MLAGSEVAAALRVAAASSCVGFLRRTYGGGALRAFLVELGGRAPEAAVRAVYHTSLAHLDQAWRRTLRERPPGGVMAFLRSLVPYLRPHALGVLEILVELAIGVGYTTYVATQQRVLFDDGIVKNDMAVVVRIIATLVVLYILTSLVAVRQNYVTAVVSQAVLREMRVRVFALIQRLDLGYLQNIRSGDILSRLTSDLSMIEYPIGSGLAQGTRMLLMLIFAVAALLAQNPRFAVLLLLATPLFVISARRLGPLTAWASRQRQRDQARLTSTTQEDLAAQPLVKAFGLEDQMMARYARELDQLIRSAIRFSVLSGLTGLTAQSITTGIQLLVLGIGAWLVISQSASPVAAWLTGDHPLTIGTLPTMLALMAQVVAAMQGLNGLVQMFQQASGPMDRIDELLRTQPAVADSKDARPLPRLSHALELENVSFGYTAGQPVLNDVSLTIPAGQTIALVGPSGCGKSTILGLLERFYDPQRGHVTLDGVDLRQGTLESLRRQTGVVFQESVLLDLSVRENIRLANPTASDAEVEEAARQAEIHDTIVALPDGYDTRVGERGGRLSGGQRQRIAIARALVRDPAILLLDEATSALDPQTEAAINATLRRLGAQRTTISISHRLAGITHAHRIYVLQAGSIVEQGDHAALLRQGGLYARLWAEQMGTIAPGVDQLKRVPLFADLPYADLAVLGRALELERYAAGELIVRQDDIGDKLYVLEEGQVEVVARTAAGGERPLATLRAGDYFGEVALLKDVARTASVRALTPVVTASLRKQDFLRELEAAPGLRQSVERDMAQRLARAPLATSQTHGS